MLAELLKRDKVYQLGDPLPGIGSMLWQTNPEYGAIWTGEKRPVKPGEWYLSGSVITAYRNRSKDYTINYPYHIARIVRIVRRTYETYEPV